VCRVEFEHFCQSHSSLPFVAQAELTRTHQVLAIDWIAAIEIVV